MMGEIQVDGWVGLVVLCKVFGRGAVGCPRAAGVWLARAPEAQDE